MNGRDFQGRRSVQARQDSGNPLREHRLARPRRPEHRQMMPTSRAHLGGPPGHRLAEHLGQVGRSRVPIVCLAYPEARAILAAKDCADAEALSVWCPACVELLSAFELRYGRAAGRTRRAAQPVGRRRQAAGGDHAQAGYQGGLGRVLLGHHHSGKPFLGRGRHGGQYAAHRPQPSVEAEFAEEHHPVRRRPRHPCLPRRVPRPRWPGRTSCLVWAGWPGRGRR